MFIKSCRCEIFCLLLQVFCNFVEIFLERSCFSFGLGSEPDDRFVLELSLLFFLYQLWQVVRAGEFLTLAVQQVSIPDLASGLLRSRSNRSSPLALCLLGLIWHDLLHGL